MPETIYIELLDEGVDVWRPVEVVLIEENWYRISSEKLDPSEQWAFETGDVVRCETRQLSGELVLVAVETRGPIT
jgi:hypothetical protein